MRIVYTGAFRFPDGDAASQRVVGIARALRLNGSDVVFCGWERYPRTSDLCLDGLYRFDDFVYYSQGELDLAPKSFFHRMYHSIFRGRKTLQWLNFFLKSNTIDVIVVYNSNSFFIYSLYKFCKHYNIKLVCDCTEWYDGSHLPGGKFGLSNFDNNFRIRIIYPIVKNIISISSFLDKFFEKRGCNSIVIPPIMDSLDSKWNRFESKVNSSNSIRLIYAGVPGKKDLIGRILAALDIINKSECKILFTIVGADALQIKEMFYSNVDILPLFIKCLGRVKLDLVPQFYKESDFSIIVRKNRRYAHAGFPTKLVESFFSGVPVISNCTSDIPKYLVNHKNGFLLNGNSIEDLVDCFNCITSLSKDEILKMKLCAKETALSNFDFKSYSKALIEYFNNLN